VVGNGFYCDGYLDWISIKYFEECRIRVIGIWMQIYNIVIIFLKCSALRSGGRVSLRLENRRNLSIKFMGGGTD
jgi:hypothetical protein